MPTRADRRRQRREESKATKTVDGVSRRLLDEVRDELESLTPDDQATPEVNFAQLLDDWHTADHNLAGIRLSYQRTLKLKKQGRNLETDPVVKRYAENKQEQQAIEEQMVDLLDGIDDDDKIVGMMNERHLAAGRGFIWTVTERLKKHLLDELGLNEAREVLGGVGDLETAPKPARKADGQVAQPTGVSGQG